MLSITLAAHLYVVVTRFHYFAFIFISVVHPSVRLDPISPYRILFCYLCLPFTLGLHLGWLTGTPISPELAFTTAVYLNLTLCCVGCGFCLVYAHHLSFVSHLLLLYSIVLVSCFAMTYNVVLLLCTTFSISCVLLVCCVGVVTIFQYFRPVNLVCWVNIV
jgi:hypothetical protein